MTIDKLKSTLTFTPYGSTVLTVLTVPAGNGEVSTFRFPMYSVQSTSTFQNSINGIVQSTEYGPFSRCTHVLEYKWVQMSTKWVQKYTFM